MLNPLPEAFSIPPFVPMACYRQLWRGGLDRACQEQQHDCSIVHVTKKHCKNRSDNLKFGQQPSRKRRNAYGGGVEPGPANVHDQDESATALIAQ